MSDDSDIYRSATFSRAHRDDLDDAAIALRQAARGRKPYYRTDELRRMSAVLELVVAEWDANKRSEHVLTRGGQSFRLLPNPTIPEAEYLARMAGGTEEA